MAFTTASLIAAGIAAAAATAGAVGSAVNTSNAQKERSRSYKQAKDFLNTEYYRDPLSSVGNRALLKTMDERLKEQNEAMENRAAAGGATMENQLAMKQAGNRAMSNVYTTLLQGEDARRDAIRRQQMQLDQNYSQGVQMDYRQSAQDWQSWGSQMANAAMSYGSADLLNKG